MAVHCIGTAIHGQVFGICNCEIKVGLKVLIWRQKGEEEMRGKMSHVLSQMSALLGNIHADTDHQKGEQWRIAVYECAQRLLERGQFQLPASGGRYGQSKS